MLNLESILAQISHVESWIYFGTNWPCWIYFSTNWPCWKLSLSWSQLVVNFFFYLSCSKLAMCWTLNISLSKLTKLNLESILTQIGHVEHNHPKFTLWLDPLLVWWRHQLLLACRQRHDWLSFLPGDQCLSRKARKVPSNHLKRWSRTWGVFQKPSGRLSLKPKFFSFIHSFQNYGFSTVRSARTIFRRPENTYELLNLSALNFSPVNKVHIFQCMGKIFCVEFQWYPLKCHTKYLTHTLKYMIFIQHWNFKSS